MRDLGDMIQRVRRKTGDYADTMIEDPHIETAIATAAEEVWQYLLSHSEAKKMLLTVSAQDYSSATSLVADQEEYALPSGCMLIYDVQLMINSNQAYWDSLKRADKPNYPMTHSGNELLYGNPADTNYGLFWCAAESPGKIAIWPTLNSVSNEKFRYRYYARPSMPSTYGNTLNDPDGDGTADWNFPDRICEVIEWGALLDLATDKVGANVSYEFASKNWWKLMRMVLQVGNPTTPTRKYIHRVRG